MKAHIVVFKTSEHRMVPYTHEGVRAWIRSLLETYGISRFELAKRAGVNPATIYQILKKSGKQVSRPPRLATIQAIARSFGTHVAFQSSTNTLAFRQLQDVPRMKQDDFTQFLLQVADALEQSGRTELPRDERDKILRVIRVLL